MSNKRIDEIEKEFIRDGGEFIDAVFSPPITYVAIRLGRIVGVGYMRCGPEDVYDAAFSVEHAMRKALKHIDEQRQALRCNKLRDIFEIVHPSTVAVYLGKQL